MKYLRLITIRSFLLPLLFLLSLPLVAQVPDYLKDVNAIRKKVLYDSFRVMERPVWFSDSLVSVFYQTEEEDRIFYTDLLGFPTSAQGKYFYVVEGQAHKGSRYGVFTYWAVNAKRTNERVRVKTITFRNDTMHGDYKYYYASGMVAEAGAYYSNVRFGKVSVFYPDGKTFSNYLTEFGKVTGTRTDYYPDGRVKQIIQTEMGMLKGPSKAFYQNGKVQEEWNYVYGKAEGKYRYYHPNGQLWVETEYRNNLPWTVVSNKDASGNDRDAGTLREGNGTIKYYTEEGKLYLTEYYKNGVKFNEFFLLPK